MTAIALVLGVTVMAIGQTPGTGNAGQEVTYGLGTPTIPPVAQDLAVSPPTQVLLQLATDGSLVGAPYLIAIGAAASGSDPTNDLGTEYGIVGLPFTLETFILINGFAYLLPGGPPLPLVLTSTPLTFGINLEARCPSGMSFYSQSLVADPSKPNGFALPPALELNPNGAPRLPHSDDGSEEIALPCLSSAFPFFDGVYSSVWLNANGSLTFGAPDPDPTSTIAEFFTGPPRIAFGWTDLDPTAGGPISIDRMPGLVTITFDMIPGALGATTSTVTLSADGTIVVSVTETSEGAPLLVGITPGDGIPATAEFSLRSPLGTTQGPGRSWFEWLANDGTCEEDPRVLNGLTATFSPNGSTTLGYSYAVSVSPSFAADAITPATVPAGAGATLTVAGQNFTASTLYRVFFGPGVSSTAQFQDACALSAPIPATLQGGAYAVVVEDLTTGWQENAGVLTVSASTLTGALALTDDGSDAVTFANGSLDFLFYGLPYGGVFVNANGNLTLGVPDTDFSESLSELITGPPRIAPHWDDMNPLAGGSVTWSETFDSFSVMFDAVPAYVSGSNGSITTLNKIDGSVVMSYAPQCTSWNGVVEARTVLAGISAGSALGVVTPFVPGVPGVTVASQPYNAIAEWMNTFAGSPFALDGRQLIFTYDPAMPNVYTLTQP